MVETTRNHATSSKTVGDCCPLGPTFLTLSVVTCGWRQVLLPSYDYGGDRCLETHRGHHPGIYRSTGSILLSSVYQCYYVSGALLTAGLGMRGNGVQSMPAGSIYSQATETDPHGSSPKARQVALCNSSVDTQREGKAWDLTRCHERKGPAIRLAEVLHSKCLCLEEGALHWAVEAEFAIGAMLGIWRESSFRPTRDSSLAGF